MTAFDVIVCGSLHLDIMVHTPALPRLDETAVGTAWGTTCGGKGGNQAVMAARFGARTAMIGRTGADDFGLRLRDNLAANGVSCAEVSTDADRGSGMSAALLQPDGGYGAVIVSGANLGLNAASCGHALAQLGGAKVLLLQNEIPAEANAGIAQAAGGAHVILNAAPARAPSADLYDHLHTLVVNRVEAEMIAGMAVATLSDALAALPALGGGRRNLIITLGGDGLVLQPADGAPETLAPHRITPVSTHGAGDCFIGALASRLAQGATLFEAAGFANRAAATYVSLTQGQRDRFDLAACSPSG
jgi:ribokinase